MSIFNGLLNTFKNNNTKTNNSATRAVVTGTSVGQSNKTKAPQSQPVRWNAKSQSKSSVSSDTCGAANWFNGIGATSAKTPDKLTVYDGKGNPLTLTAADSKASGGEGTVYTMPGKPNVLVKIYKDEILAKPEKRREIETRLFDMLAIHKEISQDCFAWPRAAVYNKQKQVIGFAMNCCKGVSFQSLSGLKSIQRHFPQWNRYDLALVAQDFLLKLQYLASKNVLVNDFNPANFLVDEQRHVHFIDCDSFQVPGEKRNVDITKTYFASHTAPELLANPKLLAQPRNIHQVEFSAALTVFNILMCGLHPYSYFDPTRKDACGTPDENLRKGRCPLGVGSDCKFPEGNWYNLWSYLTFKLKDSLIRTFKDGHNDPSKRATLAELQANVKELLYVMKKDPVRLDLNPTTRKPKVISSQGQNFSMDF